MRLLTRLVIREVAAGALLGISLFTFVFFLRQLGTGQVFSLLLRSAAEPRTIAYLLSLLIPPTLPFTVPVGTLVGILIGLSRMSGDNEVTAMRAAGVPARVVLRPILVFAFLGVALAGAASVWLTPWSIRETLRISNQLAATQLTAEIQPRVFEESFPNMVIYVGDVISGSVTRWRNIFMADLRPPGERQGGPREAGEAPPITIASEAIASVNSSRNTIQLSMRQGYKHETGKDSSEDYNSRFPAGDQELEAQKPGEIRARSYSEMDTLPLARLIPKLKPHEAIDPRIELHQRLSLPWACLVLALLGVALGVSTRKAGRSSAFVMTVAIALAYFMGMVGLIGLARQSRLPLVPAMWAPNVLCGLVGVILLIRLEKPGDFDLSASIQYSFSRLLARFQGLGRLPVPRLSMGRIFAFPLLVDTFVLNTFLFYLVLWLFSFLMIYEVYTFFELLPELVKNKLPLSRLLTYQVFLAPKLLYDFAPLSVLVAVLVTFGVMSKNNEVTALKACGVSLYRLALPVLVAAGLLSGGLFAFDHYAIPGANRKQDALRNEIKGKPIQTYLRPDQRWIFGHGSRIYYYRYFDPAENVMSGVSVYELDPETFHLRRLISAERARWEEALKTWVFQGGQMRVIDGVRVTQFRDFAGQTATFPELDETPAYFRQEVKLSQQMNYQELSTYISDLSRSGLDTIKLQVQLQSKFSTPVVALLMALISIPFAFLAGNRGAMAGVGVSLGVAIVYFSVSKLFEQMGFLNQLPPTVAAWAPVGIFAFSGLYFIARMKT